MRNPIAQVVEKAKFDQRETWSFSAGRIVRITRDGQAFVAFPGSQVDERKARVAIELSAKLGANWGAGLPVILMFEDGDVGKPELAFLCNMSVSTFKREFEKNYAESPIKWFQNKRLEYAHHLLFKEQKSSSEIYFEVGYENLSSFIHAYKSKYGITPKQHHKD